jgi:hypothetical protein
MLQSFFHGLSVCCPFFLSDALLTRALLEASHIKCLVPSYGIFLSRLPV